MAPGAPLSTGTGTIRAGKLLRDKLPREQLGEWTEFKGRTSPIDILRMSDAGRMKELVPIRYGRMLQSPFAFYRGAAGVMASDLSRTPHTGLAVQACGDCHLMNFGGFATPERNIIFDINDFDETSPAPWEWDVKRLVASIVLAARSIGLSDRKGRKCAETAARSYREHMREFCEMDPLGMWYRNISAEDIIGLVPKALRKSIKQRIDKAAARSGSDLDFPKLTKVVGGQVRITDQPPLIFHPETKRGPEAKATLDRVFLAYRETLADDRRILLSISARGCSDESGRCRQRRSQMLDRFVDVRGKQSFVSAVQGGGELCARALCGEEHVRPSWPARCDGPTFDATGIGYLPRLAHRPQWPAVLRAAAA
jgi:hypothetical protein